MSEDRDPDARTRGSRFRRATLRLTVRGVLALLAGIAAFIAGYSLGWREALVVGSAAVLLPIVGLVIARVARPRLEVVRVFSPVTVPAGDAVRVSLAVRNALTRTTLPGVWNDGLPWWEEARPQRMPALTAAGTGRDSSAVFAYELHPSSRGIYPVGPLAVELRDPFGMARAVTAQGAQDRLVVVPRITRLAAGSLSTAEAEGEALLVQRRATGNDDDLTTREYRPGDALRRVHWRASARHGELMVRQEEQRSFPEVRLLLDTRRDGYPDARLEPPRYEDTIEPESDAFEWAVEMFASLGMHLYEQGFHVTIEESARHQVEPFADRWEGGRRDEAFLASLAAVALADPPIGDRPGSAETASAVGPLFAVVGRPSEPTVDWLRRQRRAGEVAVAFLADDDPGAGSAGVAEELRGAGWLVVEGGPGHDLEDAWAEAHELREDDRGRR